MPTVKLFYTNSYLTQFSSIVVDENMDKDGYYIILKETAFHPKGGGQPSDRGIIKARNETFNVVEVVENNDEIRHYLDKPSNLKGRTIQGEIDWQFRLKNMQSHTALHILWKSVRTVLKNPELLSSGITEKNSYLHFRYTNNISDEQINEIENLTNKIIFENRQVNVRWASPEEIPGSRVDPITGKVRLIDVENWDTTPCGGTHVSRTSEIQVVKVIGLEKSKKINYKLKIIVGRDAIVKLLTYEKTYLTLKRLLSTDLIVPQIEALLKKSKECVSELEKYKLQYNYFVLSEELKSAKVKSYYVLVKKIDISSNKLRELAIDLAKSVKPSIVVLATVKPRLTIVAAKSKEIKRHDIHMVKLLSIVAKGIQGGASGNEFFAMGGGKNTNLIDKSLKEAYTYLLDIL